MQQPRDKGSWNNTVVGSKSSMWGLGKWVGEAQASGLMKMGEGKPTYICERNSKRVG